MTIGPEPRMRMRWRSSRRGIDALQETIEEVEAVVRAGPRLGVVLDGAARHVEQLEALDGAVIEVDVAELRAPEVGLPLDRLVGVDRLRAVGPQHGEAVVLRGDLDLAGRQVLDRVVAAAVAERELERLQPDRPAQQWMAEADAPDRLLAHDLADRGDDVVERRRVAGPVGQE